MRVDPGGLPAVHTEQFGPASTAPAFPGPHDALVTVGTVHRRRPARLPCERSRRRSGAPHRQGVISTPRYRGHQPWSSAPPVVSLCDVAGVHASHPAAVFRPRAMHHPGATATARGTVQPGRIVRDRRIGRGFGFKISPRDHTAFPPASRAIAVARFDRMSTALRRHVAFSRNRQQRSQ